MRYQAEPATNLCGDCCTVQGGDLTPHCNVMREACHLINYVKRSSCPPGCNAGPSEAAVQLPGQKTAAPLSMQRAAYARTLGLPAMLDLARRVDNAHEQVYLQCCGHVDRWFLLAHERVGRHLHDNLQQACCLAPLEPHLGNIGCALLCADTFSDDASGHNVSAGVPAAGGATGVDAARRAH